MFIMPNVANVNIKAAILFPAKINSIVLFKGTLKRKAHKEAVHVPANGKGSTAIIKSAKFLYISKSLLCFLLVLSKSQLIIFLQNLKCLDKKSVIASRKNKTKKGISEFPKRETKKTCHAGSLRTAIPIGIDPVNSHIGIIESKKI